mmetsp:Transcript_20801/g.38645  ORF Transcript_20801/g.38645 Transcript_20801/m.38645 type:complete len:565 (-) Transcript_20801:47-1741(-)
MLRSRALLRHFTQKPVLRIDIGPSSDFAEGTVKSVQLGQDKKDVIAVSRVDGRVYAVSNSCPHYGAPMHMGYLDRHRLACPWHIAEFDVRSGEMLSGPALKSLQSFPVKESDGRVAVDVDRVLERHTEEPIDSKLFVTRNPANTKNYVIVGGGASAQITAETLRRGGFEGRITMISNENQPPYDRTVLSKNLNIDSSLLRLRDDKFYEDYGIDVVLNTNIARIDPNEKGVVADNGSAFKFDKLAVGTGCKARIPKEYREAYEKLKNVFSIRSAADQAAAKSYIENAENVVIIGGSFLGMETAKSIKANWPTKNVTVIEAFKAPLSRAFGIEIAEAICLGVVENDIDLKTGAPVESIVQKDGYAVAVKTGNEEIKVDALLLATGAQITTEIWPEGFLAEDNSVVVNAYLQALHPDIYATGDIASFPSVITESRQRIEHWKVAQDHGIHAALNMLGQGKPYTSVPFFWTNMHINAQFVGFGAGSDSHATQFFGPREDYKTPKCTVFYKNTKAVGIATCNIPNGAYTAKIALERDLIPRGDRNMKFDFKELKEKVEASSRCTCSLAL